MSVTSDLPKDLQALVTTVGRQVTSQDVDVYRQLQRIKDETYRLRTVLKAWKDQQTQDRNLRDRYAFWLMVGLGVQVVTITVIYVLMGLEVLKYEVWTANTFIMGVFVEIAALVLVVVKYLFTPSNDKVFQLIERLENERP